MEPTRYMGGGTALPAAGGGAREPGGIPGSRRRGQNTAGGREPGAGGPVRLPGRRVTGARGDTTASAGATRRPGRQPG